MQKNDLKTKRICLVANSPFTLLNFRYELIILLIHKGYSVSIICPKSCNLMSEVQVNKVLEDLDVDLYDISVSRSGINPFDEIKVLYKLGSIFKKVEPDLILNYTVKANIYGCLAALFFPKSKVFCNITGLGYSFTGTSYRQKILSLIISSIYRFCLKRATKVFFQNKDDVELFTSRKIIKSKKVSLLPGSGVLTSKFKRSDFDYPNVRFLFVGRILKDKGVIEYLDACKKLNKKYKGVTFSILGHFDENPNAIKKHDLLETTKISGTEYLGATNDMVAAFNYHNVFVLPSYREGKPKSALEAMSMSMPIITTTAVGCDDVVEEGVNGFKVPVGDAKSLADAMELFILDPNLINQLGSNSRKIAESVYDSNIVINKICYELGI